jgi:hypothetical protein
MHPAAAWARASAVHRHGRFGRHDKGDPVVVQPPQIGAIPKAFIKDHFLQAGVAGQMGPGVRSPCRLVAPRWQMPWRTCWAAKPTKRIKASSLKSKEGRAFMLSTPNKGFSP